MIVQFPQKILPGVKVLKIPLPTVGKDKYWFFQILKTTFFLSFCVVVYDVPLSNSAGGFLFLYKRY